MAKGKLTDVELTYIKAKYTELTPSEIAKALGRTQNVVLKTINELLVQNPPKVVEVQPEPTPEVKPQEKKENVPPAGLKPEFIRKERGDGNITILTEQASQFSDEFKNPSRKKEGPHIHKPLGKK